MTTPREITEESQRRYNDKLIVSERNERDQYYREWHTDTLEYDQLYRGEWASVFPDETALIDKPKITNLVQVGTDDLARLATETTASVRCDPDAESDTAVAAARLREAIIETHWVYNDSDRFIAQWIMDLCAAGLSLALVWPAKDCPYPKHFRIDPRGAYPNFYNDELIDLLVVSKLKQVQIEHMYPGKVSGRPDGEFEVIDFYTPTEIWKIAVPTSGESKADRKAPIVLSEGENHLGRLPIAYAKMHTADGKLRGIFNQVKGSLATLNTIVTLAIEDGYQKIYSPFEEKNVENWRELPGPTTVYHHIPGNDQSFIRRIPPASNSFDLWQLLGYVEGQARAGTFYPATRGGQVDQAIASASFVNSTMGSLTTMVRYLLRLVASQRRMLNEISLAVDETYLDKSKPLMAARSKKKSYTPSNDISGKYLNRVVYGAGAGLDVLNKHVQLTQDVANGVASKRTAMEQSDYIVDPAAEEQRIQTEQVDFALLQRAVSEGDFPTLLRLRALMAEGKDLAEASIVVDRERTEALQASLAGPEGAPAQPVSAEEQALALEKGALSPQAPAGPGVKPPALAFAPPPLPVVNTG